MKKAYIFDLDGTLVDSMTCGWVEMLTGFLAERGIAYPSNLVKSVITFGLTGCAKYYREKFGVTESEEESIEIFKETLRHKYENEILAKPNVEIALRALKERGISINVLTASPHAFLDPCLKRLGLFGLFDNCWTIEDFGTTKSDPNIYRRAAEKLNYKIDECVMVDDSIAVIRTAKSAGMPTIGVFDEFSADSESEMCETADGYIYDFLELLND